MKVKYAIILILLSFPGFCGNVPVINFPPTDSIAESKFTLTTDKVFTKIEIEYVARATGSKEVRKDSSQKKTSVFDQFFAGSETESKKILTEEGIKNEILRIISQNQELTIQPEYPAYVLQTFSLIRGRRKKNKAKLLYITNNPDKLLSSQRQGNYTLENGNYVNKISLTFRCVVRIKKNTQLNIPEFLFMHDNKTYRTKALTIDLRNT